MDLTPGEFQTQRVKFPWGSDVLVSLHHLEYGFIILKEAFLVFSNELVAPDWDS